MLIFGFPFLWVLARMREIVHIGVLSSSLLYRTWISFTCNIYNYIYLHSSNIYIHVQKSSLIWPLCRLTLHLCVTSHLLVCMASLLYIFSHFLYIHSLPLYMHTHLCLGIGLITYKGIYTRCVSFWLVTQGGFVYVSFWGMMQEW